MARGFCDHGRTKEEPSVVERGVQGCNSSIGEFIRLTENGVGVYAVPCWSGIKNEHTIVAAVRDKKSGSVR